MIKLPNENLEYDYSDSNAPVSVSFKQTVKM